MVYTTHSTVVIYTHKPTSNTNTSSPIHNQQSQSDDTLIMVIIIASLVIIVIYSIGIYLCVRKRHKLMNLDKIAEVIKKGDSSNDDIDNNADADDDNQIEGVPGNIEGDHGNNGSLMEQDIGAVYADENVNISTKTSAEKRVQNDEIRLWLQNIGFPHYFQNFFENGYESIGFIKEISNELELEEIGIAESHRIPILHAIEKLKNPEIAAMEYDASDNHESIDKWLEAVALSHYTDIFIETGYNSMESLRQITDISELNKIGVYDKTDCLKILQKIKESA